MVGFDYPLKRGDKVKIDGIQYTVTAIENYGFFVRGRLYIVLWSDNWEVIKRR